MPAPNSASPTNAPGPTDPRPTARQSASTAPWATAGPTPATTPQKPNDAQPCRAGSTSTITTGSTPRSVAHRPAGSTTCLDITASRSPASCPTRDLRVAARDLQPWRVQAYGASLEVG